MKDKYFPNNWKEYHDAPDDMFIPHTFEEIMTWKVAGWEIPSSVYCIIRATNRKTGKVKEYVYQRRSDAHVKVAKLLNAMEDEIAICDHESIHYITPGDYS